jgi:hypothetical protein
MEIDFLNKNAGDVLNFQFSPSGLISASPREKRTKSRPSYPVSYTRYEGVACNFKADSRIHSYAAAVNCFGSS